MKKSFTLKASAAPLALGLALVSSPALAQDGEEAAEVEGDAIVVTGSRIQNPNLELSSPVTFVGSEELELRQTNTAEQFLRELPASVPSTGSAVNNGNGGSSFVNLRGIGSQRNLVLLDGRRFVPADTTGRVDLNSIPLAVIERTDVLTGGATTTYGADAVSGVVNFITKKDFAGLEANASSQVTEQGDGETYRVDLTLGANFDDGRGNAVLSIGYQDTAAVFQGDRDFSEFNIGSFNGNPSGSSNAVPAVIVGPIPGGFGQLNEQGTEVLEGVFDRPFNFNPFNIFQTPFERYNIYGAANYEVSDAVEVYTQAAFSKQTVSTIIAPGGSFFNTYQLNLNNPNIPDAVALQFCEGLELDDAACAAGRNTQFGATLEDGTANPDYVQFASQVRRRSVEAGTRNSDFTSTLFNIVAGARGGITDNIFWDVSATYGESERIQRQSGFARFDRLQQSLLALPDGTCSDPSGGCVPINLFGTLGNLGSQEAIDYVFSLTQQVITATSIKTVNGSITGDFGWGIADTPISFATGVEYREFTATRLSDEASQTPGAVVGGGGAAPDINGSYDVYDVFGEVIIPVLEGVPGAENLTLELGGRYSDYSTAGTEFTWKAGGTWEPIPGFSIRGNYQRAARAPNIGELFAPVTTGLDNLAVDPCQGPSAPTGNLLAACLAQVPAGSPGADAIQNGNVLAPAAGQINVTGGGNPNLGTEEATTWTVGAIFQPDAIPGLSLSVDYFNIEVESAISSPAVGDVISACFDNPSATNPDCQITSISRNPFTGGLDGSPDETPGLFLNASNLGLIQTDGVDISLRYSTDLSDTIGLSFSSNTTWTNENTFQAAPGAINRDCVSFYSVNCGSIQPEWVVDSRLTLSFDDIVSVSLRHRYMSATEYEPLQFATDVANAEASNRDENGVLLPEADQDCPDFNGADAGGCLVEPDFRNIPAEHYFDLSAQFDATENILFTITVQNLFDNQPHVVGSDIGSTAFNSGNIYPSSYDALGRRYGASVKLRF